MGRGPDPTRRTWRRRRGRGALSSAAPSGHLNLTGPRAENARRILLTRVLLALSTLSMSSLGRFWVLPARVFGLQTLRPLHTSASFISSQSLQTPSEFARH